MMDNDGSPFMTRAFSTLRVAAAATLCVLSGWAIGQKPAPAAPAAKLSTHVQQDIQRHRAMAAAHEGAARCLESGRPEGECLKELQMACKGLAIGKYCGMKHEH